jgi:hypothetical protein
MGSTGAREALPEGVEGSIRADIFDSGTPQGSTIGKQPCRCETARPGLRSFPDCSTVNFPLTERLRIRCARWENKHVRVQHSVP